MRSKSMSAVKVSNLSATVTEQMLREFFAFCGKISSVEITPGLAALGASELAVRLLRIRKRRS